MVAAGFITRLAGAEPALREFVIVLESRELVPVVVDRVDARIVRALQIAGELQIVGRIGEDEVHGIRRQLRHLGGAVADQNACLGGLRNSTGRP